MANAPTQMESDMIGLSMVTPPGPDFGAETDHGIVLVFEGFQAVPALQNLTADG